MYPEFIYFLKVNIALVLFYAFYRLFFYSDTFFNLRRGMLQTFLLMAVLYPLLDISGWVKEYKPVTEAATLYVAMLPEVFVNASKNFCRSGKRFDYGFTTHCLLVWSCAAWNSFSVSAGEYFTDVFPL